MNPKYDPSDSKSLNLNTAYHYYISDDCKHDNFFVQHCFNLHWQCLRSVGFYPKHHIFWSNGCPSQFNDARPWFCVSCYPNLTSFDQLPFGCAVQQNYWGSGHGKGPHDGTSTCLKQALRKEQLKLHVCKMHQMLWFSSKTPCIRTMQHMLVLEGR